MKLCTRVARSIARKLTVGVFFKYHRDGDRRGQSGAFSDVFVPGTRSPHPLPGNAFCQNFLRILISIVGISPCAKFHTPTLQGGVEQRVLLCGSERESCSLKEAKRPLHFLQHNTLVSTSFSAKLCTYIARHIGRSFTAGVCEKVSPGRG